jgi:VanZ family protein
VALAADDVAEPLPHRTHTIRSMPTPHPALARLSTWLLGPRAQVAWVVVLISQMLLVCLLAFDPVPRAPSAGHMDKLQHLLAFTALSFAAHWAWASAKTTRRARTLGLAWRGLSRPAAAMLGFGVFIEAVQAFIPARSASLADVLADALGIALGLSLALSAGTLLARQAAGPRPPERSANEGRAD